jgi:Uma2 family endonuclease
MMMIVSTQEQQAEGTDSMPVVVRLQPVVNLTEDQFFEFCQINHNLRIERNAQGELSIMTLTGSETGDRNAEITMQLRIWAKRDKTGKSFDSSAGFRLPNGAVLSPDASWLRLERWNALSAEEKKKFAPVCPDFVIELRSESDRLRVLQEKMQEWRDSGAELGLLVDPFRRRVHIYRPDQKVEILDAPETVSCDPELPGFTLDLREIW